MRLLGFYACLAIGLAAGTIGNSFPAQCICIAIGLHLLCGKDK